jgi:integration host factor subunit beta
LTLSSVFAELPHAKINLPKPLALIIRVTHITHMTRSELISLLTDKHPHLTASDVEFIVKIVIDSIGGHLVKGGRVEIRGFGSFSSHARPPRLGRNPKTGEKVHVPRKYVPHFKPGNELRERVNQWDALKETAMV